MSSLPGVVTSAVPAAHVTCAGGAGGAGRREQEGARAALQGTAAQGREAEVGKEKSDTTEELKYHSLCLLTGLHASA